MERLHGCAGERYNYSTCIFRHPSPSPSPLHLHLHLHHHHHHQTSSMSHLPIPDAAELHAHVDVTYVRVRGTVLYCGENCTRWYTVVGRSVMLHVVNQRSSLLHGCESSLGLSSLSMFARLDATCNGGGPRSGRTSVPERPSSKDEEMRKRHEIHKRVVATATPFAIRTPFDPKVEGPRSHRCYLLQLLAHRSACRALRSPSRSHVHAVCCSEGELVLVRYAHFLEEVPYASHQPARTPTSTPKTASKGARSWEARRTRRRQTRMPLLLLL